MLPPRSDHLLAPHSWVPVLSAEEAPPSRHRQTRNALGSDVVEIARLQAQAASRATVAVADRGINRRFRGVIVARP
jgi:hypothetical protein